LSQAGQLEVPVTYLRSLGYFPAWGPRVAEWLILRKANANGESGVCGLFSLVPYPKRAQFAFLTLLAKYWGSG
jgi:hypothetical protein